MKSSIKSFSWISLIVMVSIACQSAGYNQTSDIPKFKLIVEPTDTGIKLQSIEGSAWTELTFSLPAFKEQYVNQFGMTDASENQTDEANNLANYLIAISKTETGITLKGIAGTAWKDLEFSLKKNQQQAIDQYGMSRLN